MNFQDQYPNLSTDALTRILLKSDIDPLPYQDFIYAGQYMNRVIEKRKFVIPSAIRLIGHHAFVNNPMLHEIVFEEGVDLIERNAFADNCSINTIYLPNSVSVVQQNAFANCERLTDIYVYEHTQLQDAVFRDCVNLSGIHFCGTRKQWNSLNNNCCLRSNNSRSHIVIHCSDHVIEWKDGIK